MTSFSSSRFISSCAYGVDWRQAAARCLQDLADLRTPEDGMNIGFLYISDTLAEEARTILYLFQEATGIESWVGTVGVGICGADGCHFNEHAVTAMIGRFPDDSFQILPGFSEKTIGVTRELISPWLANHAAVLALIHGDPALGDPQPPLDLLNEYCGAFPVGGLTASRGARPQFCGTISSGALSGVLLDHQIPTLIGVTQACTPMGGPYTITDIQNFQISGLDNRPALEVMSEAMIGDNEDLASAIMEGGMDMTGEILAAIPIKGSDTGDFMVRNIAAIDPQDGWLAIADYLDEGDEILFVQRRGDTAIRDMQAMLQKLKTRCGEEKPTGAIYISCATRCSGIFPEDDSEIRMIRQTFGDIPLVGYYASGEISAARLYTYSGVLILFM